VEAIASNPNGARALRGKQVGNADAVAKIKANAAQRALDLAGIVNTLRASGLTSVRSIAEALNDQGIPAPRGDTWHPTAVSRMAWPTNIGKGTSRIAATSGHPFCAKLLTRSRVDTRSSPSIGANDIWCMFVRAS
jgi:hypothetical protein